MTTTALLAALAAALATPAPVAADPIPAAPIPAGPTAPVPALPGAPAAGAPRAPRSAPAQQGATAAEARRRADATPDLAVEAPFTLPEGAGRPSDGVVAIVDEQIVTLLESEQLFLEIRQRTPVNTPEDEFRLQVETLNRLILDRLAAQAGSELGIPPEGVESQAALIEADRIGSGGGVLSYGESLRRQGLDPLTARERTTAEIYRYQWEAFVSGDLNYGGGRPAVDAFVRPGELRAFYEVQLDRLGTPGEVSLQVITIDAAAAGGQEYAADAGRYVLDQLAAGESWNELAELYSSTNQDTFGIRPRQPLARIADDDLRRFAGRAEAGDVSEVLPRRDGEGVLVGVQVARLLERTEGEPPPAFDDPELQNQIRGTLANRRRATLVARAEDRLLRGAYIWTAYDGLLDLGSRR